MSARAPLPVAGRPAGVALVVDRLRVDPGQERRDRRRAGPGHAGEGPEDQQESKRRQGRLDDACSPTPNGSAVVVELHNDSGRDLIDVPIAIDVLDAKGKSVYRNDIPGIEPALAAVPFIPAGGDAVWVNDQVLAAGKPDTVEGDGRRRRRPRSPASCPRSRSPSRSSKATRTPASSPAATSSTRPARTSDRLLLYAVARQGGKVVAAGRGAIEHAQGGAANRSPTTSSSSATRAGAELDLTQFPTLPGVEAMTERRATPSARRAGEPAGVRRPAGRRPALLPQLRRAPRRAAGRLPPAPRRGARHGGERAARRRGDRPAPAAERAGEARSATTRRWPPSAASPCSG